MSQQANAAAQTGTGQRPGKVTAAAVILIVLGSLASLGGVLMAAVGSEIGGLIPGATGAIMVVALLTLAFGVLEIVSGAKIIKLSPGGGRVMGIVLSIIGVVFSFLSLISSFSAGEATFDPNTFEITQGGFSAGSFITALIGIALYAFVAWVLITSRSVFTGAAQSAPPPPPPPPA